MQFTRVLASGIPSRYLETFERLLSRCGYEEPPTVETVTDELPEHAARAGTVLLKQFEPTLPPHQECPLLLIVGRKQMKAACRHGLEGPHDFLPATNLTVFDIQRAFYTLSREHERRRELDGMRSRLTTSGARAGAPTAASDLANPLLLLKDRGDTNKAPTYEHSLRRVEESIEVAKRYEVPLTCMLIAIDGPNQEPVPDSLLAAAAGLLKRSLRSSDQLTLLDQNEFLVVTPFTPRDSALHLAERLRSVLTRPAHDSDDGHRGTPSFGIATFEPPLSDADDLLDRASQALQLARDQDEVHIEAL